MVTQIAMILLLAASVASFQEKTEGLTIDQAKRSISFSGTLYPSHFNALTSYPKNHHFIVWREGKSARNALIQAHVSDLEIGRQLVSLGARPGNNLTQASWEKRKQKDHPDPDLIVEGTPIQVLVSWSSGADKKVASLLVDQSGRGYFFRFGGHAELARVWGSGCVVCLESCPGARISNTRYTMRDLAKGLARFSPAKDLPADGTKVKIVLQILDEK